MKKLFALLLLIQSGMQAHAVYISEIMYDPLGSNTSRRWVEIYNDTGSAINLVGWKFYEDKTNHGITSSIDSPLGTSVVAGSYAIIADNPKQFLVEYPSYAGVVYDTAFSLPVSGTDYHIALKESSTGQEISPVDYNPSTGGSNDGSTLSKIDGVWVRSNVTPGLINQVYVATSSSQDASSPITSTTTSQGTITQATPASADILLYLPTDKVAIAGADTTFSVFGLTKAGKQLENCGYMWAYGDGGQGTGSSTLYRYAYPGRYIASVEGGNGYVVGTGRMSVRVIAPDIMISDISTGKYGTYVDIENPNSYDLDFSQWRLMINNLSFPFPKNTLIRANAVTHFSGLAMGFASTTISSSTIVKILFPSQEEVTRYSPPQVLFSLPASTSSTVTTLQVSTTTSSLTKGTSSQMLGSIAKPLPRKVSTPVVVPLASTTLSAPTTTSTTKRTLVKDTRIVSFFKSLFNKK